MYSIAQTFLGSHAFYNFEDEIFNFDTHLYNREIQHFTDEKEKALEICEDLFKEEQAKPYGSAKTTYLFFNDKLIKTF